jgi:hypothetical protein
VPAYPSNATHRRYESELLQWFDKLLGDLRKRIDGNSERLKAVDEPLVLPEDQQRLDNLTTQIKELLGRAAVSRRRARRCTLGAAGWLSGRSAAMGCLPMSALVPVCISVLFFVLHAFFQNLVSAWLDGCGLRPPCQCCCSALFTSSPAVHACR